MQTQTQQKTLEQKASEKHVVSTQFKHGAKAQEIIDKLKSGEMKFIC